MSKFEVVTPQAVLTVPPRFGLSSGAFSKKPVAAAGGGAGAAGGAGGGVVGAGAGAAGAAAGAAGAGAAGVSSAPPQATTISPPIATISDRKINRFMNSLSFRETCGLIYFLCEIVKEIIGGSRQCAIKYSVL